MDSRLVILSLILFTVSNSTADYSRRYFRVLDQVSRNAFGLIGGYDENVASNNAHQFLDYLAHMTTPDWFNMTFHLTNVSESTCFNDLGSIALALVKHPKPTWALKFIDAMVKLPAGVLDGNLNWFGSFDECISIQVRQADFSTDGQYCLVPIFINQPTNEFKNALPGTTEGLNLGFCLPSSCTPGEIVTFVDGVNYVAHMVKKIELPFNLTTTVDKIRCYQPKLPTTNYYIAALIVIAVVVSLNVFSSVYDVIRRMLFGKVEQTMHFRGVLDMSASSLYAQTSQIHSAVEAVNAGHDESSPMNSNSVNNDSSDTDHDQAALIRLPTASTPSNSISPTGYNGNGGIAYDHVISSPTSKVVRCLHSLVMYFSFVRNAERILELPIAGQEQRGPHNLGVLHGIRTISLLWVMLGHTFVISMAGIDNILPVVNYTRKFEFQVINQAMLSVDSFFIIGGFLLGYLALREMDRIAVGKHAIQSAVRRFFNWIGFFLKMYLLRYLRLTPCLAFIIIIYLGLAPGLLNGPLWPQVPDPACVDHWWTNILYVNNLVKRDEECIGWTWYLAADWQMFIVSPIPLMCFFISAWLGWVAVAGFVAIHIASNAIITWQDGLSAAPFADIDTNNATAMASELASFTNDFFSKLYILPWCRCGPWALGLGLGCTLSRMAAPSVEHFGMKKKIARFLVGAFTWFLSILCGLVVVYGLWPVYYGYYRLSPWVDALYWGCCRISWALAVSWVIYACATGWHGAGPVRKILAWRGFVPLARLTYCAYLVHPIVIASFYLSLRNPVHLTPCFIAIVYAGCTTLSFAIAFIVAASVEMPFANLSKMLIKGSGGQ